MARSKTRAPTTDTADRYHAHPEPGQIAPSLDEVTDQFYVVRMRGRMGEEHHSISYGRKNRFMYFLSGSAEGVNGGVVGAWSMVPGDWRDANLGEEGDTIYWKLTSPDSSWWCINFPDKRGGLDYEVHTINDSYVANIAPKDGPVTVITLKGTAILDDEDNGSPAPVTLQPGKGQMVIAPTTLRGFGPDTTVLVVY